MLPKINLQNMENGSKYIKRCHITVFDQCETSTENNTKSAHSNCQTSSILVRILSIFMLDIFLPGISHPPQTH